MSETGAPQTRRLALEWGTVLLLLTLLLALLVWYPLYRTPFHVEISYNEGWNAYHGAWTIEGGLYREPPRFVASDYPPLYWWLQGWLIRAGVNPWMAGRWISLAAYAAMGLLVAAIVTRLTGSRRDATFALLCYAVWLAAHSPARLGMNDPQMLGMAVSLAGLYCYVRGPESTRWLLLSAVAFCVGGFIKHNLIVWPAAVGVHLLLTAPRRLARWALAMAAVGGAMILLILVVDGPLFFRHLVHERSWFCGQALHLATGYLYRQQIPVLLATAWSWWNGVRNLRGVLVLGLVAAHLVGFGFCGGDGVNDNIFMEAILAAALIVGVAAGEVTDRLSSRAGLVGTLALLTVSLGVLPDLRRLWMSDRARMDRLPRYETEFRQAIDYLRARPGEALCEATLLCYEAGKPYLYDAHYVLSQTRIGRLPEGDVLDLLRSRRFQTIQIRLGPNERLEARERSRFSTAFMRELLESYRLDRRDSSLAFLVPKEVAP